MKKVSHTPFNKYGCPFQQRSSRWPVLYGFRKPQQIPGHRESKAYVPPDIPERFHSVVHVWQAFQKLLSLVIEFLMAPQSVRPFDFRSRGYCTWCYGNFLTFFWRGYGSSGGSVLVPVGGVCSGELPGRWRAQELGQDHSCHILSNPHLYNCQVYAATSLTPLHFFKAAMKRNLSPAYVKEDLMQLGVWRELCMLQLRFGGILRRSNVISHLCVETARFVGGEIFVGGFTGGSSVHLLGAKYF